MIHDLKCLPEYFKPVANGEKTVELRRDDRGFQVGDILHLREWDQATGEYTGAATYREVTHITCGTWLAEGFCAMSIRQPNYETMLRALKQACAAQEDEQ